MNGTHTRSFRCLAACSAAAFLAWNAAVEAADARPPAAPAPLLAHWSFDSAVEGRVNDDAGNGHHAAHFSKDGKEPRFTQGIHGKAALLAPEREEGYSVADSGALNMTAPFTVTAWIKPNRRNATLAIACMKGDKSGAPPWPGWRLRCFWASAMFEVGTPDGTQPNLRSEPWSIPPGFWSHVAATWDGKAMRLYVNAVEKAVTPFAGSVAPQRRALILGNYIGRKNGYPFDGAIDDIRIYGACLDADQILAAAMPPGNAR